jgi:hypothetical protein
MKNGATNDLATAQHFLCKFAASVRNVCARDVGVTTAAGNDGKLAT